MFHELDPFLAYLNDKLNKIILAVGGERNPFLWLNEQIDHLLERRLAENVKLNFLKSQIFDPIKYILPKRFIKKIICSCF